MPLPTASSESNFHSKGPLPVNENPYQSPSATTMAVDIRSGDRGDLKRVAQYQKGVLVCILVNLATYAGIFLAPPALKPVFAWGFIIGALVATVFVFALAIKVYHVAVGVILGLLTLIPLLGLFVLLVVNQKATRVLTRNGIKVGFLGANLSTI